MRYLSRHRHWFTGVSPNPKISTANPAPERDKNAKPKHLLGETNELPRGKPWGIAFWSGPSFRARHGIQSGFLDTGFRRYDGLAASRGEFNVFLGRE